LRHEAPTMARESTATPRIVRFGTFEADLSRRELRKSGVKIKLHGQPFEVLAMLLERPGETVPREVVQQRLWPTDTFVDFDHGVNTAINRLRRRWVIRPKTRASSRLCRVAGIASLLQSNRRPQRRPHRMSFLPDLRLREPRLPEQPRPRLPLSRVFMEDA
jgi:DNA-binding response OmpR family regulator